MPRILVGLIPNFRPHIHSPFTLRSVPACCTIISLNCVLLSLSPCSIVNLNGLIVAWMFVLFYFNLLDRELSPFGSSSFKTRLVSLFCENLHLFQQWLLSNHDSSIHCNYGESTCRRLCALPLIRALDDGGVV